MPYYIKDPNQNRIEALYHSFRLSQLHGPFNSIEDADAYWAMYSGGNPFYDNPELIDVDFD